MKSRSPIAASLSLWLVTTTGLALAQATDHLTCYKVDDPQAKVNYTADLDGLVPEPGCRIKVPAAMTCVPASKANVVPDPPGGGGIGTPNGFNCYKVKCPKTTYPAAAVEDQFGSRTVTPKTTKMVCAPNAGPTDGGFPATGQTTAYPAWKLGGGGPVPVADDGTVRAGAALRYADNGDGTVTDLNTGLVWEKKGDDGGLHDKDSGFRWTGNGAQATIWDWLDSVNTEGGTGFAGYSDWRIPNLKELASIANYEVHTPAVSTAFNQGCTLGCSVLTCSCTASAFYWSSTTYAPAPTTDAWVVNFLIGSEARSAHGSVNSVRAVRGG
jgi:hypothetical protein